MLRRTSDQGDFQMRRLAVLTLACAFTSAPASANHLKTVYSTIELKTCKSLKRHPDGGSWLCRGIDGLSIYVAEGDLRTFVAVGIKAQNTKAATQTLGPFNSIFPPKSKR